MSELEDRLNATLAAPKGKPNPMDLLGSMLQSEVTNGLAEAKAFEQFVRKALADIMSKEMANGKAISEVLARLPK